ncbi:MAG TPA: hypothetical protein VHZ24_20270 [Pirellulales bacterium]|jgi:hypothetical protein|nr:hypothetical protein [Pirellulales bacterium]
MARIRGIHCPKCLHSEIYRSKRFCWEWLLLLVFCRPYRCLACQTRFIRPIVLE